MAREAGASPESPSAPRPPALIAIFLLALAARAGLWAVLAGDPLFETPALDSRFYLEAGRAIADGNGLSERPFFMTPGYTGWVAAFSLIFLDARWPIIVVQGILDSIACVLTAIGAGRLFGPLAGSLAGVFLALHGPAILGSTRLLPESPAVLIVAALLIALPRSDKETSPRRLFVSGLLLGLLGLLRTNALLFGPFLALGALPRRGSGWARLAAWRIGACVAGVAAALAPATLYNVLVGGAPVLVRSAGAVNFYIGNAPDADGRFTSLNNLNLAPGRFIEDTTGDGFERSVQAFAEEREGRALTSSGLTAFWLDLTLEGIAEDPLRWARLLVRKAYLFVNAFEIPQVDNMYFMARSIPPPGALLAQSARIVWPLGLVGFILLLRPGAPARLALLFFIAFSLSVVLFFVTGRHRLPIAPVFAAFAGMAVAKAVSLARSGERGLLAGWIALTVAAALLCNLNPTLGSDRSSGGLFSIPEEYLSFANQHNNLAARLLERGELDAAAAEARKGLTLAPNHPLLRFNLARALMGLGDIAGAIAMLERGLERHPGNSEVATMLGTLRFRSGDVAGARAALEGAVRARPGNARAWNTLGLARHETGDVEGGMAALREASRLMPSWSEPRLNLALMLERAGRRAEAAAEARAVLESEPANEQARRILGALERGPGGAP